MEGFGPNDLIVNGDMRSNGDFTISDGSPTINGSVYASPNQELVPPAAGIVNQPPVKMSDATLCSMQSTHAAGQAGLQPSTMGRTARAIGITGVPSIFDTTGQIINNAVSGRQSPTPPAIGAGRKRRWRRIRHADPARPDSDPQIVMPDLSDTAFTRMSARHTSIRSNLWRWNR